MAEIRVNATGELKLYDSDDSNYVSFKSAGTVSSNVAWTLPSADGSSGQALTTDGSGTLSWATASSADPSSADGDTLGTASAEWSDLFLADGGTIQFGNDQEVRLIHTADTGLILKHTATADDKPISLTLQTGETDIAQDDVIGIIDFQAPDEGTGTDAILVAAGIEAVSEGNFSSSNNATKLSFKSAASEAAAEKMSLSSAGLLTVANGVTLSDGDLTVASGHGISFAATSDSGGSMSNELLDDYEEGDWTIAVQDASSNAMTMSSDTTGSYTKIGNKVYISGHFSTSSLGSASGDVRIYGLPFAATSGNKTVGGATIHWGSGLSITAGHVIAAYVQPSSSFVSLRLWDATTGVTALQTGEWTADGASTIGGFYTVA